MTAQEITDVIERLKNHNGDKHQIGVAIKTLLRLRLACWTTSDKTAVKPRREANRLHACHLSELIEKNRIELDVMFTNVCHTESSPTTELTSCPTNKP